VNLLVGALWNVAWAFSGTVAEPMRALSMVKE